jgi:TonB family protein
VPLVSAEGAPEPKLPDTVLPAPPNGWPSSYEALRDAITARQHGRTNVFISDITTPKPLTAGDGAAFFLTDLGRPIEVKADGDVLLPNGKHSTIPVAAGTTSVFGAPDEMVYVAVTILRPADVHDDTLVIFHGQKPLTLVSRVDPKYPVIESMRSRSGIVMTQLRIQPDGSVGGVTVLRKVQPQIDEAVVDAFKQWRFQPPTHDGKPVTAYMIMAMNYQID